MSEPKLISPLLDQYVMGPSFSEHHGVACCPAMTKVSNKRYIVKIISIPASQVQLDALLLAGAYSSKNAALSYYKDLADGISTEAEILKKLSRFEGFVPYEDLQIVEMDDGNIGYQVYLLSPYKLSLERHMQKNPMTQLKAVNLGLDLCASMVMCRRAGYLYVDLKPGNIFINEKNEYCIGDLGFVRLDSLKYASIPDKYRSAYTAPELDDALASLNETVDIYSIGMILYQVYNDGKLPGDGEITPPAYADYEMAEIIMKAISPDPGQRWQDPMEMGQALVAYMQRNSVNDVPIVPLPETVAEPEAPVIPADETPVAEPAPEESDDPSADPEPEIPAEPEPETPAEPEAPIVPADEAPAAEPAAEENGDPVADPEPESPAEPEPETPAEPEPETPAEPEAPPAVAEDAADLTFMNTLVQDDTAPNEETVGEAPYADLSDETSDILAQADELLAMEIPEPVVAPEPIEIPIPAPIVLEANEAEASAAPAPVDENGNDPDPAEAPPAEPEAPPASDPEPEDEAPPAPIPVPETPPAEPELPDTEEPVPPSPKKKKNIVGIVALILALALLLGAAAYGYHYYQNEYLQTINGLEISGSDSVMFVTLDTDIDDDLLTVTATDSYGNSLTGSVSDGVAAFKQLSPDTIYKITVTIDGFHELRGETSGTYTTPAQTNIVQFEATAGTEPDSVILTFTVDGPDSDSWTINYYGYGEDEKSVTFSGHVITINGLTAGKEYTFKLMKPRDIFMGGVCTTTFTISSAPIFAEDLTITESTADGLTAVWTAPEHAEGVVWSVRCYSDSGYDQTVETTDLTVTFTDIDPTQGYTVEVTAQGMSSGVMTHISARSASITGSESDISEPLKLTVTWTYEGDTPLNGWLVTYEVPGTGVEKTTLVTEPSLTVYPAMPGDEYHFTVTAADGITVFNNTFSYTAGPVKVFSGYGVDADDMSFRMCRTPNKSNWSWQDLGSGSYTDTFNVGEKVSFVVQLNSTYNISDDYIDILFVVRNSSNEIVCTSSTGSSWTYLWDGRYCELDIPTMPTEPGRYSVNVYFNGMAAARDFFTIQ